MNILVVENDATLRRIIAQGLTLEGHSVKLAGNGIDGLKLAQGNTLDAIIVDADLPMMATPQFIQEAHKLSEHVRIVVLCGDPLEDGFAHNPDVYRFIYTPLRIPDLIDAIGSTQE